jgi:hypothetical protein
MSRWEEQMRYRPYYWKNPALRRSPEKTIYIYIIEGNLEIKFPTI